MALARRALTILIAVAVAALPLGAATAGMQAPVAKQASASAHADHATSHGQAPMPMAATADPHAAGHCKGKTTDSKCCDDEGTCAQTCLQKCFGQAAVMPPERSARQTLVHRFAAIAAERPPGWSSTPQPPPPRT